MKALKDQFCLVISICLCFIRNLLLENLFTVGQTVKNPLPVCVNSGYVLENKRMNVDNLLIGKKRNGDRANFTICSNPHFRSP